MALSWDINFSRVILLGASEFLDEKLPSLPSVKNNIFELKRLIEDSGVIGIPSQNICTLLDQEHASVVATQVALQAREAFDTLFIYYAGHGKISRSGELLLTVKGTNTNALEASTIHFRVISDIVLNSPAAKKIIVIDSCFSGRAINFMGVVEDLVKANTIEGTYLITSVPRNDLAQAFDTEKIYTAFTSKLIRAIRDGISNNKSYITINDIYNFVRGEATTFIEPQRAVNQNINEFRFAINRCRVLFDFDVNTNTLESNSKTIISKIPLNILKKYEAYNGLHSQRFLIIKDLFLKQSGLNSGDWVEVDIWQEDLRLTYEYCTLFGLNEEMETSVYMPLVMRNLLRITDFLNESGRLARGYKLKIKKFIPDIMNFWEITSDDFISQFSVPSDLQQHIFDERLIAIRNLEFDRLQLDTLSDIILEFFNEHGEYFVYDAKAIRLFDNPGRAVIGINKKSFEDAFKMKQPFKLRVSPSKL
jgi:Caspase domain